MRRSTNVLLCRSVSVKSNSGICPRPGPLQVPESRGGLWTPDDCTASKSVPQIHVQGNQGSPVTTGGQESGMEQTVLRASRRSQPYPHLDFQGSRTVRPQISVVLSPPVCGGLLHQPQDTSTEPVPFGRLLARHRTSGQSWSLPEHSTACLHRSYSVMLAPR